MTKLPDPDKLADALDAAAEREWLAKRATLETMLAFVSRHHQRHLILVLARALLREQLEAAVLDRMLFDGLDMPEAFLDVLTKRR